MSELGASVPVTLSKGTGTFGTGVFLLGRREVGPDEWEARSWICLFSVPIVPLARGRFRGPWAGELGSTWSVDRASSGVEPGYSDVLSTYAKSVLVVASSLAPGWLSWQRIYETGLWPGIRLVLGVLIPILVLMWRDLQVPRLSRGKAGA